MGNEEKFKVGIERLKRICGSENELDFCSTSKDVEPFENFIGQERAIKAMDFGLKMEATGYNIFVAGAQGTGKSTYTESTVKQAAKGKPVPMDWCYIYNFNDRDNPMSVSLPAGKGKVFKKDMEALVSELKILIPRAFEGSDYRQQRDRIIQSVRKKLVDMLHEVEKEANDEGFMLQQLPGRVLFLPVKNGQPIQQEEYEKYSIDERKKIEEKMHQLQKKMNETMRYGQNLEKQGNGQIVELEKKIAYAAAEVPVNRLKEKYGDFPKILEYLEGVLKDVVENHRIFKTPGHSGGVEYTFQQQGHQEAQEEGGIVDENGFYFEDEESRFTRYSVNLFVNNERLSGAPVIIESSPNYYNLFGKIEYKSHMMSMTTDFTMVKSGALQRANGGYLILQAKDLLMDPFVWDALKKALKYREAIVENMGEQYRLIPTTTLRPQPIPLDVKILLIGTPIFYAIFSSDEDFEKLFKIKVDFDIEMPRHNENVCQYVSFVSTLCREGNLKHFDKLALARIVEYGSRLAADQNKLSTRFNDIKDIVYEASAFAAMDDSEFVDSKHVKKAIDERKYRLNKLEEKIHEEIIKGRIRIETTGREVGQINGLSVIGLSGYSFGIPMRITARTYMGRGGVIHIERETGMSGSIHTKGVYTLVGYLGGTFAKKKPFGLTAQITFEQNYQGVEGDSASSAELYAILSSLSGVPIKQNIAVTGSVDQRGKIQPIGGAVEKIEGFFDICNSKGLTGDQGVMIPDENIEDLMLKDELLDAVAEGKFNIYAVKTIEEGIFLLTDTEAGKEDDDGAYPEGTIFEKVAKRLIESYENRKEIENDKKDNGGTEGKEEEKNI
ncbi:Lon protease family protein [Alkalibacter saccharofermentans]|uniref:endopeptidase La n=1 Tax=Alkalibacter saccharofermentans DSM 14828 TaxID=1120975 RepID=A0A1M4WXN0_9FIRM|nr:AAA family ATPase [Alkalibacter saccharofermentans]SHE85996.1 lon-related putative ATP-dependent protease [Alkalibacter saccharofermentans DSM 14828]